jgi:hypothetical protein
VTHYNALRRDECSDWRINGKQGHIYAVPEGFQLVFFARNGVNEWDGDGPHIEDYVRAKRALIFCRLAQDGTGEGIFFLDRLPTPNEAQAIRDTLSSPRSGTWGSPRKLRSPPALLSLFALGSLRRPDHVCSRTNRSKTRTTGDRRRQVGPGAAGIAQTAEFGSFPAWRSRTPPTLRASP